MELVIAEKPSVARDLARVLGVRPSSGATSFESDRFVITWCIGHLVELEEPAAYNPAWKSWRLDLLPMLPEAFRLRGSQHALPQLRAVEKLLRDKRFTTVINACDAGREGELIFRYVYQHANSRIPIRRLWISSLTDDAIRRGMASLRAGADLVPLADAARSRSEADWLVGMNATRAITARGRIAGHDTLWSIGRVQTPTLAMLVERERELRAFVPVPYWEVRAQLPGFVATWRDGAASRIAAAELADSLVARDTQVGSAVIERVRAKTVREPPPQLFDLTSLQRTANRRFGFSAQRTLELAQALYERHKLLTYPRTDSRHLTKDVAAELATPITALANVPDYAPFAQQLVAAPAMWQRANRRVVDDTKVSDHHAIIPTGAPVHLSSLDRDEARLFDLVARRFLGAFFPDAEFASTEAWLRVGPPTTDRPLREASDGDRDAFVKTLPAMPDRYLARGRVRTVAGWQDVAGIDSMRTARGDGRDARDGDVERDTAIGRDANRDGVGRGGVGRDGAGRDGAGRDGAGRDGAGRDGAGRDGDRDDDREPTTVLPPLVEGQVLPARFSSHAKQTTPPPRYTEATLLGAMETAGKRIDDEGLRAAMRDTGLGTPATRASIIETLLRREYIARERTNLVATPLGESLIAQIPIASLASAELTGSWEARLAAIARGKDTRAAFMADIERYVHQIIDAVRGAPAPPAPPPGSSPPPAWQSRGKGKRPRGRGSWKNKGGSRGSSSWSSPDGSSSWGSRDGSSSPGSRDGARSSANAGVAQGRSSSSAGAAQGSSSNAGSLHSSFPNADSIPGASSSENPASASGASASSKPPRKKRASATSAESAPRKRRGPATSAESAPRKKRGDASAATLTRSASSPSSTRLPSSPSLSSAMRTSTPSMPGPSGSRAMRAPPLSMPARADSMRADLSVESTAWLADLVMTMAPKKNE